MLEPGHPIAELLRRDKRYPFEAYVFIFDALRFAQDHLGLGQVQSQDEPAADERHVTGQQLCEAIRRYALDQYGLMAKNVLSHWGVTSTGDFGEIVFNLIDIGEMRKTESDRREDFNEVYDFEHALSEGFEFSPLDSGEGRRK